MSQLQVDGLSDVEQAEVGRIMQDLDMKQTTKMFTDVTKVAFKECVTSFRGRALEKSETKCIENLVGKYMAHFQRMNVRFGEEFVERNKQAAMEQQAAMQQQQGKQ